MPELLILRHAKSAWDTDAPTDFDRPLSARGERDRWRMAGWLADEGLCPDEVVTSSALRARATAEAVVEALNRATSYLRHQLSQAVHMRHLPRLHFRYDNSFDTASHIDDLLHDPRVAQDLVAPEDDGSEDG